MQLREQSALFCDLIRHPETRGPATAGLCGVLRDVVIARKGRQRLHSVIPKNAGNRCSAWGCMSWPIIWLPVWLPERGPLGLNPPYRISRFCERVGVSGLGRSSGRDFHPPHPPQTSAHKNLAMRTVWGYEAADILYPLPPATITGGLPIVRPRQWCRGAASSLGPPGRPMRRRRSAPPGRAWSAIGGSAAGLIHRARPCPRSGATP